MPTSTQAAPATNAQGTVRRILLQGRYETLGMISNGEQLVVAVVLPLMALFGLVFTDLLKDVAANPIDAAAPGVLALCVVSTAFTGRYEPYHDFAAPVSPRGALLPAAVAAAAFTALGLLVAGTVRPEATLAITNLAWVLLAAVGGILFPSTRAPAYLQPIVDLLPSAALGDSLRSALITGTGSVSGLLILLAWTIIAGFAATRWFKWN